MKKILFFILILPQFLFSQTLQSTRLDSNDFHNVYFYSSSFGFIMGENGTILLTENSGEDWYTTFLEVEDSIGIRDMVFITDTSGFAVGDKGTLIMTVDFGNNWQAVPIDESGPLGPEFGSFRSISFFNDQFGWIAGDNGEAQFTFDEGNSWTRKDVGHPENIIGIHALSDTGAIAVLENGLLLYTDDQGETWADAQAFEDTTGESPTIFSLFGGDNSAWVAGAPGSYSSPFISNINEIDNDWMIWLAKSNPIVAVDSAHPFYTDIHFSSPDTGWVIGWDKLILFTHDAGQNWTQVASPDTVTNELNGLSLTPDSSAVWIVGNDGLVISTYQFSPPLGIDSEIQQDFVVYPNPNQGHFFLQNPFSRPLEAIILVYDLQGSVILEKPIAFSGSARQKVELNKVSQGMYFLQVITEDEVFKPQKLIIGSQP